MRSQTTSSSDELATQLDAILDSVPERTHWGVSCTGSGYEVTLYLPGDWVSIYVTNLVTDEGRSFGFMQTERHLTLRDALAAAIDKLTDIIGEVYNDDHQVAA